MILNYLTVRRDHGSLISGAAQILSNFSLISQKNKRRIRELLKIHEIWSPGEIGSDSFHKSNSKKALTLAEQLFRGLCAKNVYLGRVRVKLERISEN